MVAKRISNKDKIIQKLEELEIKRLFEIEIEEDKKNPKEFLDFLIIIYNKGNQIFKTITSQKTYDVILKRKLEILNDFLEKMKPKKD